MYTIIYDRNARNNNNTHKINKDENGKYSDALQVREINMYKYLDVFKESNAQKIP